MKKKKKQQQQKKKLQRNSPTFEINAKQFEKTRINFKNDDFAAIYVVNAKVHY